MVASLREEGLKRGIWPGRWAGHCWIKDGNSDE